jgi:hypothetical protein
MNASSPECEPLVVYNFYEAPSIFFLAAVLSFGALHTKPSWRFVESPRRIDSCLKDMLMLLKNSPRTAELRCKSFSEILRISERY